MAAHPAEGSALCTMGRMYGEDYMTDTHDVTFLFNNNEQLHGHRAVVASNSTPLRNLLYTPIAAPPLPGVPAAVPVLPATVRVPYDKAPFQAVLDYIYLEKYGPWNIDEANAILVICDAYNMNKLAPLAETEVVRSFFSGSVDLHEACNLYQDARNNNRTKIQEGVARELSRSLTTHMEHKDVFVTIPFNLLLAIFEAYGSNGEERDVHLFRAIIIWTGSTQQVEQRTEGHSTMPFTLETGGSTQANGQNKS